MRRATMLLWPLLALALALTGCGGSEPEADAAGEGAGPPVRIGTKNFTEQRVLGELYRQALEARGFAVELKPDIGSSEITHQALAGGGIDMYPEYVGVLLSEIADRHVRPASADAAYQEAKRFEELRGFTLLAPTPFSDANALAVTPRTARRHGLDSIEDLGRMAGGARIGAPPEFRTRYEGMVGLEEAYGLEDVSVRAYPIGRQYDALDAGTVDAAAVFTTDGNLADRRYVLLDDPKRVFAEQHVAPIIDREVLQLHGTRLAETIDAVSQRLTTGAMREMNAAVDLHGESPADVARRFLADQGLVG